MNKDRRKQIATIPLEQIAADAYRLQQDVEAAKNALEHLRDEEQESFDNLPESLQTGEQGEKVESAIEALDTLMQHLDELDTSLTDIDVQVSEFREHEF